MWKFIVSGVLVAVAGALQTTHIFIEGVKPNILFVLFGILALHHKDWKQRTAFILIGTLFVTFTPTISWVDVIFIITAVIVMTLVDYLPWKNLLNVLFAVAVGTLILNFISFQYLFFLEELLYNLALTLPIYWMLGWIYEKK